MVTVSAERVAPRATAHARATWLAWAGAVGLVLPLLAMVPFAPPRLSLAPDLVLAAIEPNFEAPLSVRSPLGVWVLLVTLGWFGLAYHSRKVRWWEYALVVVAAAVALPRAGNAWLVAVLLVMPIGRQLAHVPSAACVALAAVGLGGASAIVLLVRPPVLPTQGLQAATSAPGSAYVDYRWTAEVPNAREEFGLDYLRVAQGHERWQSILDADAVSVVVLDAADRERGAAELVRASTTWRVAYDDGRVLVAERTQP